MHLTLVGLSHKTAPVEIREKLTFPAHVQRTRWHGLRFRRSPQAVIISTCNRTEIYAVTAAGFDGPEAIINFMADYHDLDRHELVRYLYISQGEAVVKHLFRVVASLDSMVLGEAQILGQVKEAYDHSFSNAGSGRVFNKLFRQSFEVGKRVRTETDIGENGVSVSYAAVELAKRVFEPSVGPSDTGCRQDERADREAPGVQRSEARACREPYLRACRGARREVRRRGDPV
jgi:glutamyl-tRNA reductase